MAVSEKTYDEDDADGSKMYECVDRQEVEYSVRYCSYFNGFAGESR